MKNMGTIEQCIRDLGLAVIPITGTSMWPLLREGSCRVKLVSARGIALKKGDVVLYRRTDGALILHRIWKITQDGVQTCGDHRWTPDEPIRKEQILAVAQGFYRNGHYIEETKWWYRLYRKFWNGNLPVRRCCLAFLRLSGLERRSLRKQSGKQK